MNLFEFDSVSIFFEGRPVLEDFSLVISEGDKVIFRGASGSGKSTLIRLLLGFVRPDSGAVSCRGEELTPEVAWSLRRGIAYVNQAADFETGTVSRALESVLNLKAGPGVPDKKAVIAALESVDLAEPVLGQQIGDLSGGERQRVALASALLLERSIFLLDEPTAALDAKLKRKVADLFLENRPEWTVIAAAHDDTWFQNRKGVVPVDLSS